MIDNDPLIRVSLAVALLPFALAWLFLAAVGEVLDLVLGAPA